MPFKVVIPARYASTRLPGKPLLDIAGKPMIQHVYERAKESLATEVIIATDDKRIAQVAEDFGAEICNTRSDHPSGTDRLAEVAQIKSFADDDIIVNVQGDEPCLPASLINQVADDLQQHQDADIATLFSLNLNRHLHRKKKTSNPQIVILVLGVHDAVAVVVVLKKKVRQSVAMRIKVIKHCLRRKRSMVIRYLKMRQKWMVILLILEGQPL